MSGFWYEERHNKTVPSARKILGLIWPHINPTKVLDVGCGVGTWLFVAKELGAKEVRGLEGSPLEVNQLKISGDEFTRANLITPPQLNSHYDLSITLEVAEHLPKSSADQFVNYLCSNSDVVLFSAAPPAQGGKGHINEQWPDYWSNLFKSHNFLPVDIVRSLIWNNDEVMPWYRQNIMLYAKSDRSEDIKKKLLNAYPEAIDWKGNSLIHPQMWNSSRKFRGLIRGLIEVAQKKHSEL